MKNFVSLVCFIFVASLSLALYCEYPKFRCKICLLDVTKFYDTSANAKSERNIYFIQSKYEKIMAVECMRRFRIIYVSSLLGVVKNVMEFLKKK